MSEIELVVMAFLVLGPIAGYWGGKRRGYDDGLSDGRESGVKDTNDLWWRRANAAKAAGCPWKSTVIDEDGITHCVDMKTQEEMTLPFIPATK